MQMIIIYVITNNVNLKCIKTANIYIFNVQYNENSSTISAIKNDAISSADSKPICQVKASDSFFFFLSFYVLSSPLLPYLSAQIICTEFLNCQ